MDTILLYFINESNLMLSKINWNFVARTLSEKLSISIKRRQAENRDNITNFRYKNWIGPGRVNCE